MPKPALPLESRKLAPRPGVPGGVARFHQRGSGPPVLFVHGYPGRPDDFRFLIDRTPGARCIAVALPGLDVTPLATAPSSALEPRADYLGAVLDALSISRCVVVGHSMGAGLAAVLAAREPGRVSGLGLIAPIGLSPHRGLRQAPPKWPARLLAFPPLRPLLMPAVRSGFQSMGFAKGISDAAMVHTLRCAAGLDFELLGRAYRGFRGPTLLAYAEDDRLIEPAISEALEAVLADGPRLRFATGGHGLVKTRAAEVGGGLAAFVTSSDVA
jgi:pimeloyl-ACP methyl ester carboxylesterase